MVSGVLGDFLGFWGVWDLGFLKRILINNLGLLMDISAGCLSSQELVSDEEDSGNETRGFWELWGILGFGVFNLNIFLSFLFIG